MYYPRSNYEIHLEYSFKVEEIQCICMGYDCPIQGIDNLESPRTDPALNNNQGLCQMAHSQNGAAGFETTPVITTAILVCIERPTQLEFGTIVGIDSCIFMQN